MEQPAIVALVDSRKTQSVDSVFVMDKTMDRVGQSLCHLHNESKEPLKENEVLSHDNGKLGLVNPSSKELVRKEDMSSKESHLAKVKSNKCGQKPCGFGESAMEVEI